jgi:hypothetical protein
MRERKEERESQPKGLSRENLVGNYDTSRGGGFPLYIGGGRGLTWGRENP